MVIKHFQNVLFHMFCTNFDHLKINLIMFEPHYAISFVNSIQLFEFSDGLSLHWSGGVGVLCLYK